jgi:hypothetical protein
MTALPDRVEEKYCVPRRYADAALRLGRTFLEPDRQSPGEQCVTSLYLDSPALTFLAWQRERRRERFKLRLRRYGTTPAAPVFAEVKHKSRNRVRKHRAVVPGGDVRALLVRRDPAETEVASVPGLPPFVARLRAFAAAPQVLVRCRRQALRGTGGERALGITVDRGIEYQRWTEAAFDEHPQAWQRLRLPLDEADVVVEVKHDGRPPAWMARLMTELEPWHQSFSKYGTVMRAVLKDERGVS